MPTVTPPVGGVTATIKNTANDRPPVITSNINLNDPANFMWANGRVNLQDEKRWTENKGVHFDTTVGDEDFNVKGGVAYDDSLHQVAAIDASGVWQNAICGDNPNVFCPARTPARLASA